MMSLSTLTRWTGTALLAATLVTACSKPEEVVTDAQEPCYTACQVHMQRCQTLCKQANQECAGNATYMAALKAANVRSEQQDSTAKTSTYLDAHSCNSNCGCVPSKQMCFTLCHGVIGE